MIRHLKHHEINKPLWDEHLQQCHNNRIYACSWYLDAAIPQWEALVSDDHQAFMPLPVYKKFGLSYLGFPPFTQQLGIFSLKKIEEALVKNFIAAIPKHIRHYDLFLNTGNNFDLENIIQARTTQVLQLNNPYETIYDNYSENIKRNLKKNSFSISENIPPQDVVKMFKDEKAHQISDIKESHFAILEKIMLHVVQNNFGECVAVVNEKGEMKASGCFAKFGKRIYYLKGSSSEEGKEHGAMHKLLNYMIEKNANTDFEFDFSGSIHPGLHRFYKSFGAADEHYLHIRDYRMPGMLKWMVQKIK